MYLLCDSLKKKKKKKIENDIDTLHYTATPLSYGHGEQKSFFFSQPSTFLTSTFDFEVRFLLNGVVSYMVAIYEEHEPCACLSGSDESALPNLTLSPDNKTPSAYPTCPLSFLQVRVPLSSQEFSSEARLSFNISLFVNTRNFCLLSLLCCFVGKRRLEG